MYKGLEPGMLEVPAFSTAREVEKKEGRWDSKEAERLHKWIEMAPWEACHQCWASELPNRHSLYDLEMHFLLAETECKKEVQRLRGKLSINSPVSLKD